MISRPVREGAMKILDVKSLAIPEIKVIRLGGFPITGDFLQSISEKAILGSWTS